MRKLFVVLYLIPSLLAVFATPATAEEPMWPQAEPVSAEPWKFLDLDGPMNDNWVGNPSYDWELGPVPDSQLHNPDYLNEGGRQRVPPKDQTGEEEFRGDCAAWDWDWVG